MMSVYMQIGGKDHKVSIFGNMETGLPVKTID